MTNWRTVLNTFNKTLDILSDWIEKNKKLSLILLVSFFILVIIYIFASRWNAEMTESDVKEVEQEVKPVFNPFLQTRESTTPIMTMKLFYLNQTGTALVQEDRDLAMFTPTNYHNHLSRILITELIRGSFEGNLSVFPDNTLLRHSFWAQDSTLVLDFDQNLVDNFPAGTSSEKLLIDAILKTISANIPEVKQVQLIIDGKPADYLTGHLDISKPFPVRS